MVTTTHLIKHPAYLLAPLADVVPLQRSTLGAAAKPCPGRVEKLSKGREGKEIPLPSWRRAEIRADGKAHDALAARSCQTASPREGRNRWGSPARQVKLSVGLARQRPLLSGFAHLLHDVDLLLCLLGNILEQLRADHDVAILLMLACEELHLS